jgi:hypothetical protein
VVKSSDDGRRISLALFDRYLFYDLENLTWLNLKMCCDPLGNKVSGCWTMEALVCGEGRITFLGVMEKRSGGEIAQRNRQSSILFLLKFGAL